MVKKINYRNFVIIIILPIMFGSMLFNPFEEIPFDSTFDGNLTYIQISNDYIQNKIPLFDTVRNIFNVPFDLKRYNLYFKNLGDDGFFEIEMNGLNINVSDGKIPYGPIQLNKKYLYNIHRTYEITFFKEDIIHSSEEIEQKSKQLNYAFKVFARPLMSDIIMKIILFVLSWMSICWLATRVNTLIWVDEFKT